MCQGGEGGFRCTEMPGEHESQKELGVESDAESQESGAGVGK